MIVGSAVLSPRLNRRFRTAEISAGALVVFAGILCTMGLANGGTEMLADSSSLPGSSVDS